MFYPMTNLLDFSSYKLHSTNCLRLIHQCENMTSRAIITAVNRSSKAINNRFCPWQSRKSHLLLSRFHGKFSSVWSATVPKQKHFSSTIFLGPAENLRDRLKLLHRSWVIKEYLRNLLDNSSQIYSRKKMLFLILRAAQIIMHFFNVWEVFFLFYSAFESFLFRLFHEAEKFYIWH